MKSYIPPKKPSKLDWCYGDLFVKPITEDEPPWQSNGHYCVLMVSKDTDKITRKQDAEPKAPSAQIVYGDKETYYPLTFVRIGQMPVYGGESRDTIVYEGQDDEFWTVQRRYVDIVLSRHPDAVPHSNGKSNCVLYLDEGLPVGFIMICVGDYE